MNRLLAIASAVLLASCNTPDFGAASVVGAAPFKIRHIELPGHNYYIEVLGNNYAGFEMLERHFLERATDLCKGTPTNMSFRRGNRFPHGKLKDIRHDGCIAGGFCNRTEASFPLVYGGATCTSGSEEHKSDA